MVGTSSSSSSASSRASSGFFDVISVGSGGGSCAVKLLCSYGGKILPRYTDGRLRYVGGDKRVLSVDRSISFAELRQKLAELCGWSEVSLRCQLPAEDLDALVSITSDEDLLNLFEEYNLACRDKPLPLKIRAFLHPLHPPLPPLAVASPSPPLSKAISSARQLPAARMPPDRRVSQALPPAWFAGRFGRNPAGEPPNHAGCLAGGCHRPHCHLVHPGRQWQ